MNFNIDDPLAGILSDGSDDSFFDDDIMVKQKTPKKTIVPIAEKKNALFNIGEQALLTNNSKSNDIDLSSDIKRDSTLNEVKTAQKASPTPFKRTISKDSFKFSQTDKASADIDTAKSPIKSKPGASIEKLNVADELSEKKESTKPIERGKKSQLLLDDILGGTSMKTSGLSKTTKPATASRKQEFDLDSFLGNTDSKQTNSSKIEIQKPSIKFDYSKDVSKTKKTKSNENWLEIFQDKDEVIEVEGDDNVPAWLGGGNKTTKNVKEQKQESKQPQAEEKQSSEVETALETNLNPNVTVDMEHIIKATKTGNVSKLDINQEDLTMEGAALYLQQQESQLMIALQLKAQDEKLAAMQSRQKESQRVQREAALAQHEQIDGMLRRQAQHREQMQSIIAAHQERITQRIKALLGGVEHDEVHDITNNYNASEERRDSPFIKERKQLLQLVQSLQENHDKEIDLMETSYRRQLAFLEVSYTQTEERMKEESEKLIKFYAEKVSWLDEHHQLYKKTYEENLKTLTERHKDEHDMLRQQHLENIKVLREHHDSLLENIKNAVKQEQVLIKDSASFSSDLQELLTQVKTGNEKCGLLYEKVELFSQNTQKDSERSLQIRETQITDIIEQLRKERTNFDKEKSETNDTVKILEARLKQMTSMIEEESTLLRQKKMEFEFEKATFSKQTEFAKNVLKKQDEEIKVLKEDIQKEHQEKVAKIEEERAKTIKDSALVAKEKVSIQSLKLELEKTKAELQAQLEEMTEERTKMNTEKQELHLEEQRVMSKSRDLDLLAKTAIERQSQAEKKYSEAEFLQRKYEDRIRRVQEHVVSLNAREKQIAKEKVALSRERLSLHNERKEIEGRQQCSLCRNTQYNTEYTYVPTYNVPVSRQYGNLGSPVNAVEVEMAQLMGRVRRDVNLEGIEGQNEELGPLKDYMDPKLMMLRLDVQQVISHLEESKKDDNRNNPQE